MSIIGRIRLKVKLFFEVNYMLFSERLRGLRKSAKVSQTVLANAIGLNIKQIQRYEAGNNEPTLSVLISLADFFDVSLDYLVGRSDRRERQ